MTIFARVLVLGVSIAWFPHSLERIHRLGFDFPLYWRAAMGEFSPGWLYADWTAIFFKPLTIFPFDLAFEVFYGLTVLSYFLLARKAKSYENIVLLLGLYPLLLSLELGQITPILAWLCTTFPGSLIALCFKPYLAPFACFHAYRAYTKHCQRTRPLSHSEEAEPHILVDWRGRLLDG